MGSDLSPTLWGKIGPTGCPPFDIVRAANPTFRQITLRYEKDNGRIKTGNSRYEAVRGYRTTQGEHANGSY